MNLNLLAISIPESQLCVNLMADVSETEKVCVEIDGKVFCHMGDYVRKDAGGELFYVERSADIIKHKGYRVSASGVEAMLLSLHNILY